VLLSRGRRLNNELAPKCCGFSTIVPQTSALALVKTNKSEDDNLAFNKTCEVSLDTVLFTKRMNIIKYNRSNLYKIAFSTDSLLVAYDQIKSRLGNLTPREGKNPLNNINLRWFKTSSNKLLKGLFIYPKMRRIFITKKSGLTDTRSLILTSPRIKIIERSILNALEPVFEGLSQ
jgi:hypothetical protein